MSIRGYLQLHAASAAAAAAAASPEKMQAKLRAAELPGDVLQMSHSTSASAKVNDDATRAASHRIMTRSVVSPARPRQGQPASEPAGTHNESVSGALLHTCGLRESAASPSLSESAAANITHMYGDSDRTLAALSALALPPGYAELALKMPPPVRDLVVFNRDPRTVDVNDVLAGLGLPAVGPRPSAYPGLRSLALLNLLPKSTGPPDKVLHVDFAVEPSACQQLRAAVDEASFSAADSVDGCTDYRASAVVDSARRRESVSRRSARCPPLLLIQPHVVPNRLSPPAELNLTRNELERFIGAAAVRNLWALAHRALRKFRAGTSVADNDTRMDADDDDAADEDADDDDDMEDVDGAEAGPSAETALDPLLDAHEIFVRRYTPDTRPWFPFHRDRSELTVNVALADDALHEGGRLICLLDGAVKCVERTEGMATVHPSSFMHAVSRMTSGARYSLIIFMGRSEGILAFNQAARQLRPGGNQGSQANPADAGTGASISHGHGVSVS